ncbi:MAG: hypothetical protein ACRDD7_03490 [Peptostreptococcaceae bacterium]
MSAKSFIQQALTEKNTTLTNVVNIINAKTGKESSVQNWSNKINRGTIKFEEVEQIMDAIDYELKAKNKYLALLDELAHDVEEDRNNIDHICPKSYVNSLKTMNNIFKVTTKEHDSMQEFLTYQLLTNYVNNYIKENFEFKIEDTMKKVLAENEFVKALKKSSPSKK